LLCREELVGLKALLRPIWALLAIVSLKLESDVANTRTMQLV
jgi:hypothetical protein